MKKLLSIITMFILLGCHREINGGVVIATSLDIHYTDSSGNNLFPNTARGFVQDSINLFVMKNGARELVYETVPNAILSYPKKYFFFTENAVNYIRVFTDNNVIGDSAITYLNVKGKFEDTIKATFIHINSASILLDKAWVNGKLVSGSPVTITR